MLSEIFFEIFQSFNNYKIKFIKMVFMILEEYVQNIIFINLIK